jgi:hypothetical protein
VNTDLRAAALADAAAAHHLAALAYAHGDDEAGRQILRQADAAMDGALDQWPAEEATR